MQPFYWITAEVPLKSEWMQQSAVCVPSQPQLDEVVGPLQSSMRMENLKYIMLTSKVLSPQFAQGESRTITNCE